MKIEIEKDFPQYFKPSYPEEFELFSHFEVSAGIAHGFVQPEFIKIISDIIVG